MSRLEDIEKSIKKYTTDIVSEKIYNKSLKRDLLIVMTFGSSSTKIRVYDQSRGFNEVGTIIYTIIGKARVSVSEFVVDENFQNMGIGRMLFGLCNAHADARGVEYLHGNIDPTDPIKGVSKEGEGIDAERKALVKIYKKLNCRVSKVIVHGYENLIFERRWRSGEILKSLDDKRKNLINNIIEKELIIKEK